MAQERDAPLAGLFRVVYALSAAVLTAAVVLTAIFAFYDAPGGDGEEFGGFDESNGFAQEDESDGNYRRNVSLILMVTSAGVFATSVLGLGSRFNALRSGLLLGGLAMYLTGVGFWSDGNDQWIGFVLTLIAFAALAGSFAWLDEGLPLGGAKPGERRLDIGPPSGDIGPPSGDIGQPPSV